MAVVLNDLDTILFVPTVSGGALLLKVSSTGGSPATLDVGNPEDVQDEIKSNIHRVTIKVQDSGGYEMYVIPTAPSGNSWPHANGESTGLMSVPTTVGTSNELTVTIEARNNGVAATRSQKIIVRRISSPTLTGDVDGG